MHGNASKFESEEGFDGLLRQASRKKWVVYAKQPFGGAEQVLKYLSLYTHRCGIADGRILGIDKNKNTVQFAY